MLEKYKLRVLSCLEQTIKREIKEKQLQQRLITLLSSGKLFRGSLVLFTLDVFDVSPKKHNPTVSAVSIAASLELLHTALLVHDDILDNDDLRRGKPTLHMQYQIVAKQKKYSCPKSFGANTALCIGDALFFMGMKLLCSPKVPQSVQQLVLETHQKVCLAQMRELFLCQQKIVSEQEIFALYKTKTADYTFVVPLLIGAQLSLASEKQQQTLQRYGELLGLLFQLKDDELDLFGSVAEIGKPLGSDLREGKKTLWRFYLEKKLSAGERKKLDGLKDKEISNKDILWVQQMLREKGVVDLLKKKKALLAIEARGVLDRNTFSQQQIQKLLSLLEYSLERER